MTDKNRTDEKLFNYIFLNRKNRVAFVDTKVGGDLFVSKNITSDSLKVTKIGYDKDGNDFSGSAKFTDLSATTLDIFGDTHIYGNLLVDTIIKRTVTEVDIDISGNLELMNNLDISGQLTAKNGIDLSGIIGKNSIDNVVIGQNEPNRAFFTDLNSVNFTTTTFNAGTFGYDVSGKGAFTDLSAQNFAIFNNLSIGGDNTDGTVSSNGQNALNLKTGDINTSSIKINNDSNSNIELLNHGAGSIVVGSGSYRGVITTNQTQNLLLNTNSGIDSGSIKIVTGTNGNINLSPNGLGSIILGDGNNNPSLSTLGSKNLILNTNNNTSSTEIIINSGTIGNVNLKHNTNGMIIIGNGSTSGKISTSGTYNLELSTYSGNTSSSKIIINNGSDGNINLTTKGLGKILIGDGTNAGEITTNLSQNLVLSTNSGTDSGSITINHGTNGDLILNPSTNGKVIIPDGINDFDIASHDGTNGLKLSGILVTSTAAELNLLNTAGPGVINANKAVIYTSDGNLNFNQLMLSGVVVNSTATELNYLSGSSPGTVGFSKAVIYSNAGVINADKFQISGNDITSSAAEINLIDGSLPGTILNERAVIYDSNGKISCESIFIRDSTSNLVEVTSSAVELNLLEGSSAGNIVSSKGVIYNNSGEILANTIIAGNGSSTGILKSNGTNDVRLETGNSTTGSITIVNGVNGNIVMTPNGSGKISTSSEIATSGLVNSTNVSTSNLLIKTGGSITQNTSKSTTVVLNSRSGKITMNNSPLNSGTVVSFTVNNNTILEGDVVIVNHVGGGTFGSYVVQANSNSASTSFQITVRNISTENLSEGLILQFVIITATI